MQNTSHNEKATGPSWKAEFKGLRDAIVILPANGDEFWSA
jgi:hypothetical protein